MFVPKADLPDGRTRARRRNRAFLFSALGLALFLGGFIGGPMLVTRDPILSILLFFIFIAGGVLWIGGLFWVLALRLRDTRDVIRQAKVITAPTSAVPAAPTTLRSAGTLRGTADLPSNYASQRRNLFYGQMALGLLLTGGTSVGAVALAVTSVGELESDSQLLVLAALLGVMLLLVADFIRDLPTALDGGRATEVRIEPTGIAAPFYPEMRFVSSGGAFTMRSRWFGRVQAALPAPNAVPWKLLQVRILPSQDGGSSTWAQMSLLPAEVPWWFGGLKIAIGFLPGGGWLASSGFRLWVERRQLGTILWWASQGGSRLMSTYGSLTPAGQQAVRASLGVAAPGGLRAAGAERVVVLPPAASEGQLASWLTPRSIPGTPPVFGRPPA